MSTIKVNTIQDTDGIEVYTAKAWVNFNGQGTVAIRQDGNISSITDLASGNYIINYTNTFADANYSFIGHTPITIGSNSWGFMGHPFQGQYTTSLVNISTLNSSGIALDYSCVVAEVLR